MTERSASFDPASLAEGDELVFDDGGAPDLPVPAPPQRVKTGRKTKPAEAPVAEAPAAPEAVPVPTEPVATPAPVAIEPIAVPKLPIPSWLLIGALCLSLFTSTIATVGLLVASRAIAHAGEAREAAEAQTAQLAHVPETLETLDRLIAQEQAALAALTQGRAGQPATIGDLQKGLDGLRTAIAQIQPARDQELATLTKAGQSQLSDRLSGISDQLDQLQHPAKTGR